MFSKFKFVMAAAVFAASSGAYADVIQVDPTASGLAGVSGIEGDGTSQTFDQMGFNADSSIQVNDTDGNAGFTVGDTFAEAGNFSINSYINLPSTTVASNLNAGNGYTIFGTFTGVTGEVTNIIADANAVTNADFVAFSFDNAGQIVFNIQALDGGGSPTGAVVELARADIVSGSGNIIGDFGLGLASSNAGSAEQGSIDLDLQFTSMLNNFWLFADGSDIQDLLGGTTLVLALTDMNVDNTSTVGVGNGNPLLFDLATTHNGSLEITTASAPEPAPLAFMGLGLVGLFASSRKRIKG